MSPMPVAGELLLASTTAISVLWLWRSGRRACAFGLAFVALAALLGALEYAGIAAMASAHATATRWAAVAGFPAFAGFALWSLRPRQPTGPVAVSILLALGLIGQLLPGADYALAIGTLALLCLLIVAALRWSSSRRSSALLFVCCAITALAGLAIGTEGRWGAWSRMDLYHLALAAANLGYGWALGRERTTA